MLRGNKKNKTIVTVLATCAVMGIIPQSAFASEIKNIEEQDGEISNAIAYKDGKFMIDGDFESDEDDDYDGIYYYDKKFKELKDIDSGSDYKLYGSKYIDVDNGDYYIDLSSGKVEEDNIIEDTEDDAQRALRKKTKKIDRYNDYDELAKLTEIPSNKFVDTWFEYNINGFRGYTDSKGNYIDADHNMGSINVYIDGKKVKFKNTDDTEKIGNKKYKLFVDDSTTLGSDKDYIYRLVKISVKEYNEADKTWKQPTVKTIINSFNGKYELKNKDIVTTNSAVTANVSTTDINTSTTDTNTSTTDTNTSTADTNTSTADKINDIEKVVEGQPSMYAIQKISKDKDSDDIDDANYPKTVNTYELVDDTDKGKVVDLLNKDNISIIGDNKILSWNDDNDSVEVQVLSLKMKNGIGYIDADTADDEDYDSLDTDVNGNLYRLEHGTIYKFDNDEDWDKLYKVDGSIDKMSVYDKNNIVAWEDGGEVYASTNNVDTDSSDSNKDDKKDDENNQNNATDTNTNNDNTIVSTKIGWVQNPDNTWNYYNSNGEKVVGWVQSPTFGLWYYMNENGVMESNKWIKDKGTWYYLTSTGAMKTGWLLDNNTWYYLNPVSGAMQTGWIHSNDGNWYYCDNSGAMLSNTTVEGYRLGFDGAWIQ